MNGIRRDNVLLHSSFSSTSILVKTIATACMFLAGKVEETPRPLKDVILVSYEIIHKKDPAAIQKIKQKVLFFVLFLLLPLTIKSG